MIVMVTGTGFIANALVKALETHPRVDKILQVSRKSGWGYKWDYENPAEKLTKVYAPLGQEVYVKNMFSLFPKPDVIFHLAAEQNSSEMCYENNVMATRNLLKFGPEKIQFIHASSSTVYGDLAEISRKPMNEFDHLQPTTLYGCSKLASEELIWTYMRMSNWFRACNLRLGAVVGADNSKGVVHDIVKTIKTGNSLELWGEAPGSVKPYTHIDDVVEGMMMFLEYDLKGLYGDINLCLSDNLSVGDVADIIIKESGKEVEKKWNPDKLVKGDNKFVWLDNEYVTETLGWKPKYNTSAQAVEAVAQELLK